MDEERPQRRYPGDPYLPEEGPVSPAARPGPGAETGAGTDDAEWEARIDQFLRRLFPGAGETGTEPGG
jgi:hypothetical protein